MKSGSSFNIFIVDDDPFCRALYEQHLFNMGFQSISAFATGAELLSNLYKKPDLIFLDYHLEDYRGTALLSEIKRLNPDVFVVVVSGQSDMNITVQILNSGAFDYIIKDDYETERISAVIGKWLSAREYSEHLEVAGAINPAEKYLQVVLEAQQKVRKEISNELHDNLSQLLGASKLYLQSAQQDEINRLMLLNQSHDIISSAIAEVRKISHSLQSVLLQNTDLEVELRRIISGLEKQDNFRLCTSIAIDSSKTGLSAAMQHNVLRIIQEQFNNIIKYAQAKNVQVQIEGNKEELRFTISDDGIGFNPDLIKKGLGLANIVERIEAMNGTYSIDTSPGNGCSWDIMIPLDRSANNPETFFRPYQEKKRKNI